LNFPCTHQEIPSDLKRTLYQCLYRIRHMTATVRRRRRSYQAPAASEKCSRYFLLKRRKWQKAEERRD
jgi:hypothetical protein